jgi:hypothetical protein
LALNSSLISNWPSMKSSSQSRTACKSKPQRLVQLQHGIDFRRSNVAVT